MNLDELIIACFCVIDDVVPSVTEGKRLRQRGPLPRLADSEVLTMEVVGTYLGLSQDKALFAYFQQHYRHFFPALAGLHRHHLCPASGQFVGHQGTALVSLA